MVEVLKKLVKQVSPVDYGAYYLSDPDFAIANGGQGRAWYYQCCT